MWFSLTTLRVIARAHPRSRVPIAVFEMLLLVGYAKLIKGTAGFAVCFVTGQGEVKPECIAIRLACATAVAGQRQAGLRCWARRASLELLGQSEGQATCSSAHALFRHQGRCCCCELAGGGFSRMADAVVAQ
jgi:hypothetical protein